MPWISFALGVPPSTASRTATVRRGTSGRTAGFQERSSRGAGVVDAADTPAAAVSVTAAMRNATRVTAWIFTGDLLRRARADALVCARRWAAKAGPSPTGGTAARGMRASLASWVPTGILPPMHRWARAVPSALVLLALAAGAALAAGPPFPDPVDDQAVYDTADILSPATEQELESLIDDIEGRTGAEIVVYTQHNPDISE